MKRLSILAAVAALLAPGAAFAATNIGCIADRIDPVATARIGDRVILASDTGKSFDSSLDLDRDAVIAARNACRQANGWSNAAADSAMNYFKAIASLGGADRALAADGLSAAALKAAYAAMPEADRRGIIMDSEVGQTAVNTIVRMVDTAKPAPAQRTRMLQHVAIYFGSLSAIEFYPVEFATL